jgi:predicted dehydrogenase
MIKIGLLGAGHLGKIHLKLLKQIPDFQIIGFFDPDPKVSEVVAQQYEVQAFDSLESLIDQVDALDIVTPTLSHYDCASQALEKGKHIFIEKPLTNTISEAEALVQYGEKNPELVIQVGHVERFNPAFLSVEGMDINPMFIEGHRLAIYNPRGTDVSVVLDLMIHDLDVILSLVKSPVKSIHASGVSVISESPDIANARIQFENGCVANLTASRISMKNLRRLRIFQKNNYLAVDFLKKESEVFSLQDEKAGEIKPGMMQFELDTGKGKKYVKFEKPSVPEVNAIKMELEEFANSIANRAPVRVSVKDGFAALKTAHDILNMIEHSAKEAGIAK